MKRREESRSWPPFFCQCAAFQCWSAHATAFRAQISFTFAMRPSLRLIPRKFWTAKTSSGAEAAAPLTFARVARYFVVKPFVYASVYSASAAAATLALLSAPQFAAAPAFAKFCACCVNCSAAFGAGSVHGSLNGAHRLLIRERLLVRALPLGKIFDFVKSKNPKQLDMEASKAVAEKIKSACLDPKFVPRIVRPIAGFIIDQAFPIATICAIPEQIEQLQQQDASLGLEAVLQAVLLSAASEALTQKKDTLVIWGCGFIVVVTCATAGCIGWWFKPQ